MHLKQKVRLAMHIAVDHKPCVHFTIIGDPIVLDQVLEAYNVCDGQLGEPYQVFIAWYLAFLGDFETTSIDIHVESMQGLDYL